MYIRIKRSNGLSNLNGLRGVGVWTHPSMFDKAIEINGFTKGQFKQMNGDDDDDKDDEESITFVTEVDPGSKKISFI